MHYRASHEVATGKIAVATSWLLDFELSVSVDFLGVAV